MPKEKTAAPQKNNNLIQIILTVLLVGATFAIGSMWTELKMLKGGKGTAVNEPAQQQGAVAPQPAEDQPLSDEQWQELLKDPVYAEGNKDAKVTLVEFTDYQCPFCKRHFDQTAGQIEKDYVKTGKVYWVIRDLPLSFHQNAHAAAEAARCAGDQNKYKAMHDKLFETQTVWGESATANTLFSGYAANLGLNRTAFDQCLTAGKYKAAVDADLALAAKAGANGTPTFYINGAPIVGAQPFSAFKAALDKELEAD